MCRLAISPIVFLLAISIGRAEQPCTPVAFHTVAVRALGWQSQLLAYKTENEIDESVPPALQAQIANFKDALTALADAALSCAPADVDPKSIKLGLVSELHANRPVKQEVYDPKEPPQLDHIYGDEITVKVTRPTNPPKLLVVDLGFGIECGDDHVLLTYEYRDNKWQQTLRWQSPDYDRVSGAFGDYFQYGVLPQSDSPGWKLVTFHGFPWCTSNLSAFYLDLLQPGEDSSPTVLAHEKGYYRRDTEPVMKPAAGGIQLRMTGNSLDGNIVMRPVIYRYLVVEDKLERVQPIALNGRDFVDEWLQSPWADAQKWAAPAALDSLEAIHRQIASYEVPDAKDTPELTYGPIRRCSDSPAHFQAELDQNWLGSKPTRPSQTVYFDIQEGKNSFILLDVSTAPNRVCKGADIMAKQ